MANRPRRRRSGPRRYRTRRLRAGRQRRTTRFTAYYVDLSRTNGVIRARSATRRQHPCEPIRAPTGAAASAWTSWHRSPHAGAATQELSANVSGSKIDHSWTKKIRRRRGEQAVQL